MTFSIKLYTTQAEMATTHDLLLQLSPKMTKERFLHSLAEMLETNYRMVVVFAGEKMVGMSGLWTATKFYSGKYFEMDNVVVDADFRSHGVGQMMVDFIEKLAETEQVDTIMLDAYRENSRGHTFYKRHGFIPRGFHFVKPLTEVSRLTISPLPEGFE